jgi:hypothetical protein
MEQEFAKYKILGLVDKFDDQMVITGQLPIGSIQELPVSYGSKCVEEGTAELAVEEETEVAGSDDELGETGETGETGESEEEEAELEDEEEGATGETGEEEVE